MVQDLGKQVILTNFTGTCLDLTTLIYTTVEGLLKFSSLMSGIIFTTKFDC